MAAVRCSVRASIAILVPIALVVAVAITARIVTSDSGAAADCSGDTTLTGALPKGDRRLAPFADDSPWKRPVIAGDLPGDSAGSAETQALRVGTQAAQGGSTHSWINGEKYSVPVVQAVACDPAVTFVTASQDTKLSDQVVRIPKEAEAAAGTDRHLLVIQPDERTVVEIWGADRLASDRWRVGRVALVDLDGSGVGPNNGVRAYGGSAMGGLVRRWEVDPGDPNYTDGVIRHPLAIGLPNSMLHYAGGEPGYDADGYGTAKGYVAPATEQDFDSKWTYTGPIPMGAKVVLPSSIDIESLNLPPALRTIALALQQYGAYVTDRTGDGTVALYAEPSVPSGWLEQARGPSLTGRDLDRIRARLVVVP